MLTLTVLAYALLAAYAVRVALAPLPTYTPRTGVIDYTHSPR